MSGEPWLLLENLQIHYVSDVAVGPINCAFQHSDKPHAIIGGNGAGKTSLVEAICGVSTAQITGSIHMAGRDVTHIPARERLCCLAPQTLNFVPHLTTKQALELIAPNDDWHQNRWYQQLDIESILTTKMSQLSGGQQRRAALAMALINSNGKLLVLDEPFAFLDQHTTQILADILTDIAASETSQIILTAHQSNGYYMDQCNIVCQL